VGPVETVNMQMIVDLPCVVFGGMGMVVGGDSKIVSAVAYNVDNGLLCVVFDVIGLRGVESLFLECVQEHLDRGWLVGGSL